MTFNNLCYYSVVSKLSGYFLLHVLMDVSFTYGSLMQGDVESIASKNPKELSALLEQISGSEEFKRRYDELEEEKARAEEKKALAYQKKKTVTMERKQKKEQKEEAEKHLRLQDKLV